MNGALAMLVLLPQAFLAPLFAGPAAAAVPASALVCLGLGIWGGVRVRNAGLWWFALSVLGSEIFAGGAGFFNGMLTEAKSGGPVLIFAAAQVLFLGFRVYKARHLSLWPALALAWFCLVFAFVALINGAMVLTHLTR